MKTVACNRCRTTTEQITVNGLPTEPPGWTVVVVYTKPLRCMMTCPACTARVLAAIAEPNPFDGMSETAAAAIVDFMVADAELRGEPSAEIQA